MPPLLKKGEFNPGRLTARLDYQQLRQGPDAPAVNAANEPDLLSDAAYKRPWTEYGEITSLAGREFLYASEITAQATHRIKVWYRPGRSARDRFKYADPTSGRTRYFNVEAVLNKPEGMPVYQLCFCIEQVP